MKKPKVVLKNVKLFEGHDTMLGFNADVWINGVKCFHVHDSAYGGCYDYNNYTYNNSKADVVKANINLLNDYIETLPKKDVKVGSGKTFKLKVDMDVFIGDLLETYQKEKEIKKQKKLMQTGILFGVPNAGKYSYYNYKRPLSTMPKEYLKNELNKIIKKHYTGDVVILNTNLKELGLTV
jgi:hypothetical protein